MAQRMVMITNMVNGMISVKDPTYGINRRWDKRGQTLPIPYEIVEGMLWQDGFRRMIDSGILYIKDMKDKKDLGLEPQEADTPVNIIALTPMQMENLMTKVPFDVFKKELQDLPRVQVDNLIEYAIENGKVDPQKCAFIKQLTHKDILSAISRKNEEKKEKEKNSNKVDGRRI